MDESNPYLGLIQQDSADNIRFSLQTAVDKQPDTEARLQGLAKQYDLPVDAVRLDTGTVERRAKLDAVDYQTLAKQLPATGNLLADPQKAAIAHDDIDNLSAFEKLLGFWKNNNKALASGIYGFSEGVAGQAEAGADLISQYITGPIADAGILPVDIGAPVAKALHDIRQSQRDWREYLTPKGDSNLEAGWYSGLQSLTQNLLTLPLAIATDNPNLALNLMAANTGGQSYGKARDKGLDPTNAAIYGAGDAAIERATEQTGLNLLFKDLKVGSSLMRTLSNQIMPEMVGEQAATVLQDFNEWAVLHPEQTLNDYIEARPDAAIQTAIATAIGQGGMVTLAKTADALVNRNQRATDGAHRQADILEQINQVAAASKVMQRDPEAMKAFIDQALADSPAQAIYIDAKSFAQSGVADKIAQALPDVAQQLPTALATGGEIRIPIGDYVSKIAPTEYAQSLVEHIRIEGEEFSRAGAREYMGNHSQELQAEVERVLTRQQEDDSFQASTLAVKDSIKQQLAGVSRFTDKVNDHDATLVAQFYAVQANKFGMMPEELFHRYPLKVTASDVIGKTFDQILPDAMPSGMEQGDGQKAAAMYRGEDKTRTILLGQIDNKLSDDAKQAGFSIGTFSHSVDISALNHIRNRHGENATELKRGQLPIKDTDIAAIPDIISNYDAVRFDLVNDLGRPMIAYAKQTPDGALLYFEEVRQKRKDLAAHAMRKYPATSDAADILRNVPLYVRNDGGHDQSIDQDGNQVYNQRGRKRDDYTLDLFDVPATAGEADGAGTGTGRGLSRDDTPDGTYATRTQIVEENSRQLGTDRVDSPAEAAQALAYLSESTVERFDALITDSDGKPLAIVGAFKGAVDQASVYPATITGEAFRIEGAANIWFAHNHPSGINKLSDADRAMNKRLVEAFRGSDIQPRGFFAIAGKDGDGRQWIMDGGEDGDVSGVTSTPKDSVSVPVVERVYSEEGKLAEAITAPDTAKRVAQELSNGESGVMLMDNQHAPVAFIPLKSAESETLRSDGRMDALYRALSMSNASAAIIVNQGDMTSNAVLNLAGFFNASQVRVLDVLDKNGEQMDSRAEVGLSFSRNTFNQGDGGQRGAFNPATRTITLLDKADLSTFLHESGHFFLEMQFELAANLRKENDLIGTTAAQKQLIDDTDALLHWFGLESLDEWYNLDFEQKRSYHEQFAEGFEKYLFEGKAPSLSMARLFASFRQWMKKVYEHVRDHFKDVELSDEVRQVFDRMLATDEEIQLAQQARSMMPLFADQAKSGMTPDEYAEYQAAGRDATSTAMEQLALKGLRDMQWLQNARNRELKKLQRQHDELRREVRAEVRMEVLAQPVYQAWMFLKRRMSTDDKLTETQPKKSNPDVVDESQDSLFTAIAKLGGLDREQLKSEWNWDQPGRSPVPVFGKPLARKSGGKSIEEMAELLLDHGYLHADEHGKYDLREFEEAFGAELRGQEQYSTAFNPDLYEDDQRLAGEQVINPEALNAGRIELASLQSMFGLPETVITRLTDERMTARDGFHPDILAEMFGFSSGDELIRDLAAAEDPKAVIEKLTDSRMLQEHADLSTPEAIQRAADIAIHNEARSKFVRTEANTLAQATGSLKMLGDAAKEFAERMVNRLKVRDLNPMQYARAEVRAAKAAAAAEQAGKLDIAAAEKRNQLINMHATKAAYEAQDDIDKFVRYFKKFYTSDSKTIDIDYREDILGLLDRYNFRQISGVQIDRGVKLRSWVQARLQAGELPYIAESLLSGQDLAEYQAEIESRGSHGELLYAEDEERIKLLAAAIDKSARKSYKEATVEEMRGLYDTIQSIENLGRLKHKMLTAKDNKKFEDIRDEMAEGIAEHGGKGGKNDRTANNLIDKTRQGISGFGVSHIKVSIWSRIMDGGIDNGPVWHYLVQPANERATFETSLRAEAMFALDGIMRNVLDKVPIMDKMGSGKVFKSIGTSLNFEERFAILLNVGNESNMQRLMSGGIAGVTPKLSKEQVMEVLSTFSSEEVLAAQQIWNHFEYYKPLIAEKERRLGNREPLWIKPRPITINTRDGKTITLAGGYYPVKFDTRANMQAKADLSAEESRNLMRAARSVATTVRSFIQARVEEVHNRPLLLDMTGLYSGVNDVIHDLAWHEWVLDANKLLNSKSKVGEAIMEFYGSDVKHEFDKWRDDIVAGTRRLDHQLEKTAGFVRKNVSAAGLALNVLSAAIQPLGLANSKSRIGGKWLARGMSRYVSGPIAATQEAQNKSEWLRNRARTQFRELNELRNQIQGQFAFQEWMGKYGYWLMTKSQLMVDVPTWWGAYEKAIASDPLNEDLAIQLADQAVKDSQGGGEEVDQSGIERGHALTKLFTTFYGFMGTTLNTSYLAAKTEKSRAKLAVNLLLVLVVAPQLGWMLKEALTPGDGDDEDWLDRAWREEFSFLMGLFAFGREFSQLASHYRQYSGPTGIRMIADTYKLVDQAGQGDFDESFRKQFMNVIGDVVGLPSAQINRTITGIEALNEGKTENPAALVFGFRR